MCTKVFNAVLIASLNCCTSFFAGFAIFSIIGYMAHEQGVSVEQVLSGGADGIGLAFVVYPEGLAQLKGDIFGLPMANFFSVCFFGCLFFLGIDGEFGTPASIP